MEVKPGYKQTEVGIIPVDWSVLPLAGLSKSITDGTHFTPRYVPKGIPFFSVENVTARNFVDTKFISETEHAVLVKRCRPERGDILMTRITAGILGATVLIDWDVEASIYVSLALIKPNAIVHPGYLFRYSQSQFFVSDVERRGLVNATPKKINMQDIGKIPIPVPPTKSEQLAIAEALGEVDELLGALDRLIAKKRDLKQAAMQQLLTGQTRLPGFTTGKSHFIQSEIGLLPDDWEVERVRQLATIKTGSRNTQDRVEDGAYPFFVRSSTIERINSYSFDGEAVLTAGDGVGTGKVFHYINGKFDIHQRVYKISDFSPRLVGRFFFLVFSTRFHDRIMSMTAKSSVDSVRMEMIADMLVPLPSAAEQTAIAEVLSDMVAELAALEQRREKTLALKQGMMQELLTGRTRLVAPSGATT